MNPYAALGLDFAILLAEACVYFALCWVIAKRIDNWSVVDVAWSFGFALVGLQMLAFHLAEQPIGGQAVLMAVATILWSLRLTTHLAVRVLGHLDQEDGRYLRMREEYGERMPARMVYFYFIQAVVLAVLCLPLLSSAPDGAPAAAAPIHWASWVSPCSSRAWRTPSSPPSRRTPPIAARSVNADFGPGAGTPTTSANGSCGSASSS
jgi:steroid 5-alpha reductase family enzyme